MRWSIHLARITGIDVKLHVTFLLFLAFIGFSYYFTGGASAALEALGLVCAVFTCVVLHEFGHALAARRYGIHTPDITLLPIGGVARLERMPDQPSQEIVVAIAGPLVNVAIAAVLWVLLGLTNMPHFSAIEHAGGSFLHKLLVINVSLVLFNLIPAFPMDGGRVLRAMLAHTMDYGRATQIAATVGQCLAFVFGLVGLLWGWPMLVLIAFFIFMGAGSEAAMAQLRTLSTSGLRVASVMVTDFQTLPRQATLNDAIDALLRTSQHDFPILDEAGRVEGLLTRDALLDGLRRFGPNEPVTRVMRTSIPGVHHSMLFDRAFAELQQCRCPALPVLDSAGKLVGLFTPENVGEMMMIQQALSGGAGAAARRW
jgi:Zn-dependent protease/CBS domain-containing protein